MMDIVSAAKDPHLFRPYLEDEHGSIRSWRMWLTCLRAIYGLPLTKPWQKRLVTKCTGRNPDKLPKRGFRTVVLLCGRRSGKSKVAGMIGGFESTLSGRHKRVSKGELPMLSICAPTTEQSQVIKSYIRGALSSDILDQTVDKSNKDRFKLSNGVTVRVQTGSFRHVRSFTQICVIVDEACFFGTSEESKVKSDTELIRSIRPSLLTTRGKLIAVTSKYRPTGWAYQQWKQHFGKDKSKVLIWDASSLTMNPTLSKQDIEAEIAEDPIAARCEYENLWRDDVSLFLPRDAVETCTIKGREQLLHDHHQQYHAFCDVSGGRGDSAALCIAHKRDKTVVVDYLREWVAPFSPTAVVRQMAEALQRYHLRYVVGDSYASGFVVDSFRMNDIVYVASDKSKSELYLELLPAVCSEQVELLDHERANGQLCSLERRTRSGGRDSVDHPQGQHDDLANVIAGCCTIVSKPRKVAGSWRRPRSSGESSNPRKDLWRFLREWNATVIG